jgi:LPS export ABC transporter protein LptC
MKGRRTPTLEKLWLRRAMVLAVAVVAAACSGNGGEPSEESMAAPVREMEGFTLVETHNGVKRVEVVGSQMIEHPDQQSLDVQDVKVDFYDEHGTHQSVLTALAGTVDTQTSNMTVRGDVVVVTDDGVRLETEELTWLDERRRIVTELPVRIVRDTGEVRGVGLDTDPELREFRLGSRIEGEWEEVPAPAGGAPDEQGAT